MLKNNLEEKFSPKKKSDTDFKLNEENNQSSSPIKLLRLSPKNESSFKLNKLSKFPACHHIPSLIKKINWILGEKLAEGSTSSVFKALNISDGSTVVVKKYHSQGYEKLTKYYEVRKNNKIE